MTDPAHRSEPDAVAGQVLTALLSRTSSVSPEALAGRLTEAASPMGVSSIRLYLADLQERHLRSIPGERTLPIDSTLAGRAFQLVTEQHATPEKPGDERRHWVPLVNGAERLGVMEVCFTEEETPEEPERIRTLATYAGLIIAAKSGHQDGYAEIRRSQEMAVQAEMVWAFLAPRTIATDRVLVAATLEPAYEVGGDAFDHSLTDDGLHVSIFDSVGHDLTAGLISSVAMATCRTIRRAGGGLTDLAAGADGAIASQFGPSRFATALLCDLDTASGEFSWLPCGHPPPLLIRDNRVIKELFHPPRPPLGLGTEGDSPVYAERLQRGDRLLLYTDGVVEGRAAGGRDFGLERLSDFVIRHSAEGLPPAETLRRLTRAVLEYQEGDLRDDATVILLEWMPHLRPAAQG
jgi:serine phosphatase RsbU (regulator of sigma subunit)